jgi:hypothetical protein
MVEVGSEQPLPVQKDREHFARAPVLTGWARLKADEPNNLCNVRGADALRMTFRSDSWGSPLRPSDPTRTRPQPVEVIQSPANR